MKLTSILLVAISFFSTSVTSWGQATGDYRSLKSGLWSDPNTWQRFNGIQWKKVTSFPGFSDGTISILGGDTVISNADVMVDQVVVNIGGTLMITTSPSRFILHDGVGTDLICNGTMSVDANAQIINDTTSGSSLSSIAYNNAVLTNNGGIGPVITFKGIVLQKIAGNGYMGPLILNNSTNLQITGSTSCRSLQFIDGKVLVKGNGKLIVDQYGNTFSGQNATRFIEGTVVCVIYDTAKVSFSLPVGSNNSYLPMTFSVKQDAAVQTGFQVNIVDSPSISRTLPPSLDKISAVRFYKIRRLPSLPASNILESSLQLSYNNDDSVTDPLSLRIAKSNGSNWVNVGGKGTGSPAGTITSSKNFTIVGNFVLANATGGTNPLDKLRWNKILPTTFQNNQKLSLFSNPVKNNLQLIYNDKNSDVLEISVYDLRGILLINTVSVANKMESINLDALQSGCYSVVVKNKTSGKISVKRFVKN